MIRLLRMSITFLKNSKMLTLTAFISIFMACFLSVSMFQLSSNAWTSYKDNLLEEYGDYQIGISKNDGASFTEIELDFINNCKGVTKTSYGYYNADLEGMYVVGVRDDDLNKSRYKYKYNVNGKDIVINECLSSQQKKEIGDKVSVLGQEYTVKEILEKDPFSQYSMKMIIMDMTELHALLGDEAGQPNYIMLQTEENANNGIIAMKLESHNADFIVYGVEMSSEVQKMLTVFETMFKILFVIVIVISGMFIISIFREYMRKYRKDMAVIRAVGGKRMHVSIIFICMCLIISAIGCMAAAFACILFDDILLNRLNDRLNLFDGYIVLDIVMLIKIIVAVFVLFNLIVGVFFVSKQNILPIQVFGETNSGLRRNKNSNRFLGIRRIIGAEGYLGLGLLVPKFWQNIMIIVIIALITAFSYTGQSSIQLLIENNLTYLNKEMQGFDAYGEIYALDNEDYINPKDVLMVEEMLRKCDIDCFSVLSEIFSDDGTNLDGDKLWALSVIDTDKFMSLAKGRYMDNWESVPKNQRLIMTETTAAYTGYKLGDRVTLNADMLGNNREYTLVEITECAGKMSVEDSGAYVDRDNLVLTDKLYYAGFYIDGVNDELRDLFSRLGRYRSDSRWMIHEDSIAQIYEVSNQRNAMINLVLIVLMFVAGIGWLNSAKGMLLSRRQEYRVLRMLGASPKRVKRICYIQVLSYMSAGIIIGALLGVIAVYYIWNNELLLDIDLRVYWEYLAGIAGYMVLLSLFLIPTVRKVS